MRFCLIILVIVAYPSFGQHVLIKVSGETQPYKKIKFEDEYVEITEDNRKEKIKVSKDAIAGYYDNDYQTIYYKKPIVPDLEEELKIFPSKTKKEGFMYLEREEAGAVNLYVKINEGGGPTSMGPAGFAPNGQPAITYYYAEKGGVFKNVYVSQLYDRSKGIEALKPFVDDDPEMLKKLEAEDFRLNEKNLLRFIREYNVRHFRSVPSAEYKTVSNASFYTRREKSKDQLTVSVNDSLQFKLPASAIPLPLALPNNVPSKVCVSWNGGSYCTTIEPCKYAVKYYELDYLASDKSFDIKKRTLDDFKRYMVSVLK